MFYSWILAFSLVPRIKKQEKEKNLQSALEGRMYITKGERIQFYLRQTSEDGSGKYVSKKQDKLIRSYLQKQYDIKVLKLINQEISTLTYLINKSSQSIIKIQKLYSEQLEEVKSYINPIDISDEDYIKKWVSCLYTPKMTPDETTKFITNRGEKVRSKSELNIANMLDKYGINYKYECPLKLKNGYTIYPDFTVLNIKTRNEIYWEHRGMLDDREYAKHSVKRIKDYNESGYYLGDNLIITEECINEPLGTEEINRVIKHYFMNI